MKKIVFLVLAIFFCSALTASAEMSARIKDISKVKGVRTNQLVGYGLVTGLTGTGDSTSNDFTMQMVANMLKNFGLSTDIDSMKTKNVAAVMVTANLPPFAQNGDTIDVQVSSIGDAKSLQGGTLLFTPLKAANGQVYAVAQGALSLGGFSVSKNKNSVQKNHVTVGRIPNGATVEQSVPNDFLVGNTVTFVLNKPDFTTASRMVSRINSRMGGIAEAVDGSSVLVRIPPNNLGNPVPFIAEIENMVIATDTAAKIVVNERTGTVAMGGDVRIAPVAVSHGSLNVTITDETMVYQPNSFTHGGRPVVTSNTGVNVNEEKATNIYLQRGATVGTLINCLNKIGASPQDIIAIIQAIKEAGALKADLEFI